MRAYYIILIKSPFWPYRPLLYGCSFCWDVGLPCTRVHTPLILAQCVTYMATHKCPSSGLYPSHEPWATRVRGRKWGVEGQGVSAQALLTLLHTSYILTFLNSSCEIMVKFVLFVALMCNTRIQLSGSKLLEVIMVDLCHSVNNLCVGVCVCVFLS